MSDNKPFVIFKGHFVCKTCNEEVKTLRMWRDSGDLSWMCSQKHVTKVSLVAPKKTKKDYDNE